MTKVRITLHSLEVAAAVFLSIFISDFLERAQGLAYVHAHPLIAAAVASAIPAAYAARVILGLALNPQQPGGPANTKE